MVNSSPFTTQKMSKVSSRKPFLMASSPASSSNDNRVLDTNALTNYVAAAGIQLTLISALLSSIDTVLSYAELSAPYPLTWLFFYALSLKSRVFNPLDNSRPDRKKAVESANDEEKVKGFNDRVLPKWTPPGVVFPIAWILVNAPLRATSSMMIVGTSGSFFNPAIMAFILHLTCGDIWNTINNNEKRYGTSVIGVLLVWTTAVFAAYQYFQIDPLAGELLGGTCIWLTIASSLIIQTWRLNVDPDGMKDSILPTKLEGEESRTKFTWFQ
eukprot:CAMPEP_0184864298 /NCGR_PEP_ID=MMETSP0580-20130426/14467_1 /TAXON_ID=1118495 /ORGANISM="Dactyliosolen fragilissimus" /LENGTH=269 /DNA_ID=CAMNT_0027363015 /DNA_START=94 /DNA_END=903 /DNA_ORIENTATION=-